MKSKKINLLWAISLIVIGITAAILAGADISGFELSDTVIRIIGILDLAARPVLTFSTVKKLMIYSKEKVR